MIKLMDAPEPFVGFVVKRLVFDMLALRVQIATGIIEVDQMYCLISILLLKLKISIWIEYKIVNFYIIVDETNRVNCPDSFNYV